MRKLWSGVLCAALLAGMGGAAAAEGVKIWVPTPVKAVPAKVPPVQTALKVVNVVVFTGRDRCLLSNDFGSDYRYGGCRGAYYNDMRYPF